MKLLDLFCGAGGAGEGYRLAGFEVTGVDIKPQPRYKPGRFIQADALEYAAAHGHEYDVIHASPPCQKWTSLNKMNAARGIKPLDHPDLIGPARDLLIALGKPYVIENVQGSDLQTIVILCGVSLGLPNLSRHRHFESGSLFFAPRCECRKSGAMIGVYGEKPDGRRVGNHPKAMAGISRVASSIDEARLVMGIDWMNWNEIKEAIPPAYTEWIGRQLLKGMKP